MMVRVLENNAVLAERISLLETAQMNSVSLWGDHESVLDQWTATAPRTDAPDLITYGTASSILRMPSKKISASHGFINEL
jgi:hypothetical protein